MFAIFQVKNLAEITQGVIVQKVVLISVQVLHRVFNNLCLQELIFSQCEYQIVAFECCVHYTNPN